MTRHGGTNAVLSRFWNLAALPYDFGYLQRWVYRPAQDEMIALLDTTGGRQINDVGCGTGILADRTDHRRIQALRTI